MKNTTHISNQQGFTLIELLIVIAIMATLSSIAVMSMPQILDNYRVRGAARQVYSDMQMARLRSIKEGKSFAVDFASDTTSYEMKRIGATIKTVDLAAEYSGVKMCSDADVQFNPNGTTSIGGVTISRGIRVQRVFISSTGTGNIRIQDVPDENACP